MLRADLEDQLRRIVLLALSVSTLVGCAGRIDAFTLNRLVPRAVVGGDLEMVCAVGEGLTYPLEAVPSANNPPQRGLIIGGATSAMCSELSAWELELTTARAEKLLTGDAQIPSIKDSRYASARHHALAADRYWRAFQAAETHFGPIGEECPKFNARRDEFSYIMGLVSGMNAMLHDKTAGGPVGVPLDVLPRVARGAVCLDDADWWSLPGALQAGAWATVPGSGPSDVDAWALLEEKAAAGEASGVRVARAIQVLLASNAGRTEATEAGITSHGQSLNDTPVNPDWRLLDEYARRITLHQSDLIWTAAEGYRTPTLGELPGAEAEAPTDPFGADPFGGDPFGGDPVEEPTEAPAEEGTAPEETE
ncbi:MAG: hypothetical protein KC912_24255 [Proteobacteria bacterium]|nr:hypothetical protein [Pseudomonadota bacterium]